MTLSNLGSRDSSRVVGETDPCGWPTRVLRSPLFIPSHECRGRDREASWPQLPKRPRTTKPIPKKKHGQKGRTDVALWFGGAGERGRERGRREN